MANNVGSTTGIVGIPNPTRRFTPWFIEEVFGAGTAPTNTHIINVNDLVIDYDNLILYRCVAVSNTGIPSLEPVFFTGGKGMTVEETILGTGPGLASEGYRLYVNPKLIPSPFNLDNRVLFLGSEVTRFKVFKGVDITNKGRVISGVFNSANRLVSEDIPLEAVVIPNIQNNTYKVAKGGFLTEQVDDGEVLTIVTYNNAGAIQSRFMVLAVNTEFVRNIDASKKQVTNISIITPYLNANDKLLIEFPLSMVAQSGGFMGQVTYNDGTTVTYPVDGTKFSLFGFDTFVSSRLGDTCPLVLNYNLSETEYGNNVKTQGTRRFISQPYKIKTVESDNRYSVRLYVTPIWDFAKLQWKLEYWLYSLERTAPINVTNFIEYKAGTDPFNGKEFGNAQELSVALNLDNLGPSYSYFRHTETFSITMLRPVVDTLVSSYYVLQYDGDSVIAGKTVALISGENGNRTLDLSNGAPSVSILLNQWYFASQPLIYPFNEDNPPPPTHARIVINDWEREIPISDLIRPLTGVNVPVVNGTTVTVEFLHITQTTRLYLSRVALICTM